MDHRLTEQDGRTALRDHALRVAAQARARYGPEIDADAIMRILADRTIVRYPTTVRFDAAPLVPGEFAWAAPLGERPEEGYFLIVHPAFRVRPRAWPLLFAYHIPPINYGDIVTSDVCERFGAALLGIDVDDYFRALCELTDSIEGVSAAP